MPELYEKSCGAVVFKRDGGEIQYVIIESLEGYFGFPKGHCEPGETEQETALREVLEETGLHVHILPGFRYVDEHPIPGKPGVIKQIVYFAAEFWDQEIRYQKEELRSARLMTFAEALEAFQWENSRTILRKVDHFLNDEMERNHV